MAAVGSPGHVDAAVAHLERLERASVTEPVGHQLAQERGFQQAVEDDAGQADALRVLLVVMDLVEVALRARVLDQLPRGRIFDQLWDFLADVELHRRIIVPRSLATRSPRWLV